MNLIVAIDEQNGIGKDNKLLTHLPEDMKFFKEITTDSVVIMGRNTLESLPGANPLKNRINIVVTKDKSLNKENIIKASSVQDAINKAKQYNKEIYIIGGASIYRQFLPFVDTMFITKIYKTFNADTFFPKISSEWKCENLSEIKEYNNIKFQFTKYTK